LITPTGATASGSGPGAGNPRRAPVFPDFQGQHELIDHILISHALLGLLTFVDADVSGLSCIGVNPDTRRNASASDHAPVNARFG
jgi:hypothetical protein